MKGSVRTSSRPRGGGESPGQPRGLLFLFFMEMWERYSYYGMKALLILYLVDAQRWPVSRAATLYGNYTALAYITPAVGGYIGDRFLGPRRSLICGAVIISLGHLSLAVSNDAVWFYMGLGLVVVGTGLFKPNVSIMVGGLYGPDDPRRDSGFTIFFMGISAGAFATPLLCGYLAERVGWKYGFGAAGVGMVVGLLFFLWGQKRHLPATQQSSRPPSHAAAAAGPNGDGDRRRIFCVLSIVVMVIPFWACYEQVGSSLSLFVDHHVARLVHGFLIPVSWFQAVNPLVILACAPVTAWIWQRLARQSSGISEPRRMSIGFLLLGAGFAIAGTAGFRSLRISLVSPFWFVATDVLRSLGELALSPVGLAYVASVAPPRYASRLMAAWLMAEGIGNKLAGWLAARSDVIPAGPFFLLFALIGAVFALAMYLFAPRLNRLAQPASV